MALFENSYSFNNPHLLEEALTHKSWFNENYTTGGTHTHPTSATKGYDRLEFLGDAVLKSIQGKYLFERYPNWGEGQLTKTRAHMENNDQLALWCRHLGLDQSIKHGLSIQHGTKAWVNICSQVFESYIGAVWKDCGFDFECIYELYIGWDLPIKDQEIVNYKSFLQEHLQQNASLFCSNPLSYDLLGQSGPPHDPVFVVRCTVQRLESDLDVEQLTKDVTRKINLYELADEDEQEDYGARSICIRHLNTDGKGPSKKKAESEAARRMISLLGIKK
jgi:ribonuclease-3